MVTAINNDNILSPNDGRTAASSKREAEQSTAGNNNHAAEGAATPTTQQPEGSVDVARASQLYSQVKLSPSTEGGIGTPEQAQELATAISQQFRDDTEGALRSHSRVASTTLAALLENAPV